jgi:hypothetical protein
MVVAPENPLFIPDQLIPVIGVAIFQPAFADQQKEKLLKEEYVLFQFSNRNDAMRRASRRSILYTLSTAKSANHLSRKDVEIASDAIPEPNEAPTTSLAAKDAPVQSQNKAEQLTKDIKSERSLWSMIGFLGKDVSKAGKEAKGFTDGDPQEAKSGNNR